MPALRTAGAMAIVCGFLSACSSHRETTTVRLVSGDTINVITQKPLEDTLFVDYCSEAVDTSKSGLAREVERVQGAFETSAFETSSSRLVLVPRRCKFSWWSHTSAEEALGEFELRKDTKGSWERGDGWAQ